MNLTKQLKDWLVENCDVAADASDDDFRGALGKALADGTLPVEKLRELTAKADSSAKDKITQLIEEKVSAALEPIAERIEQAVQPKKTDGDDKQTEGDEGKSAQSAEAESGFTADQIVDIASRSAQKFINERFGSADTVSAGSGADDAGKPSPAKLFAAGSRASSGQDVRVKPMDELYSTTKSNVYGPEFVTKNGERAPSYHPFAGKPVVLFENDPVAPAKQLETLSELEKAIRGVIWKWKLGRANWSAPAPPSIRLNERDKQLLQYALHEMPWTGEMEVRGDPDGASSGRFFHGKLDRAFAKALLDDSTSEGDEIVPDFFDADLIRTPVLFGELFPLVDVVTVNRHLVEGASISTPSVAVGPAEGTGDTLETTTNFFGELNTTVNPFMGSIEVGLDFESDTPINLMSELSMGYSDALMNEIDDNIANGTGSTNGFTGIFQTTGTTLLATANGSAGPLTIGDLESLIFGVPKATRNARGMRNVFVSNEATYRKARAIAVSGTDQRRVLGMETSTHASFTALGFPWKIQSDVSVNDLAFTNLGFYRVYRRAGMSIRRVEGGQTLSLKNTFIVILRARFGGRNMLASAIAETNQAPDLG